MTGMGFTVTIIDPAADVQPVIGLVAVATYIPEASVVAPGIVGFCNVDVNELGPAQWYTAPDRLLVAKSSNISPAQIGLLLVTTGAAGPAPSGSVAIRASDEQP
jgi:hypothetical protein